MKKTGAVAAGDEQTADSAALILAEGGNAFDAALAAFFTACVTEPVLASLGGGGFLLASTPDDGCALYDFFVQTPGRRRGGQPDFYPVSVDFGPAVQEFHIGAGAIATPGLPRGIFTVHRDLGHMPLSRIVEPAVELARRGTPLSANQAAILRYVRPIYTNSPELAPVFGRPGAEGDLLETGDPIRMPEWADMVQMLVREGDEWFYRGELGLMIRDFCRDRGGHIEAGDLERYRCVKRKPLERKFGGAGIVFNPPPSSGGVLVAFALDLLQHAGRDAGSWGSAAHLLPLSRAMSATNLARAEVDADDPGFTALFEPDLVERYREEVLGRPRALRGTTHISVIDGQGNAASLSVSNGEGCGYFLPGTGLMLNNMLGEEDLNPGGFGGWSPDRRMTSMMTPALVRHHGGEAITVMGSGGSNRIRSAILQVLVNLVVYEQALVGAVENPRIHCEGDLLDVELARDEDLDVLYAAWPRHRIWQDRNMYFGGTHCVTSHRGGFDAAGDPRRGGSVRILGRA